MSLLYSTVLEMKNRFFLFECLVVAVVLLFAFGLRMYRLDQSPKGALIDEAHFGYLAKSLLVTGKDEHGVSWPIVFKGFGDQKLPGYGYALLPFIAAFDVSVFSIRLPSVIVGVLAAGLMYVITRRLGLRWQFALLSAVLMAVSPWPFFLSRFGFESNLALFFWIIGLWGLVEIFRMEKVSRLSWAWAGITGIGFAATWYSYIAYRPITVGLLILVTGWVIWQQRHLWKLLAGVWVVMVIAVLPLFHPSVREANTARLQQVGLFSDEHQARIIDEYRTFCNMQLPLPVCSVIWNKGTVALQTVTTRFLHTYSPQFLVTSGEANEKFLTVQGFGQFVVVIYPLFIFGLVELLINRKKISTKEWMILAGLLVSPLPSILAGEPQKVRISALLPFVVIIVAFGAEALWKWLQRFSFPPLPKYIVPVLAFLGMTGVFLTASTTYFVDYFTVHTAKNDYMYQSYVRELFPTLKKDFPNHLLYVKPFFSDPTMFYAFYTNMDPAEYQRQAVLGPLEKSGFQHTIAIDQVKVAETGLLSVACESVAKNIPALYITNEEAKDMTPVYLAKSENGAMNYAYVYDALLTGKLRVMECNDIPLVERQRIAKEAAGAGLTVPVLE
jgi:4-amino-4-deoxy-L-arabinose transferase-like glycosyltransferase